MVVRLSRLPRWVVPIIALGLLLGGLFTTGLIAAVCLVILAAAMLWLTALSWPLSTPAARTMRLLGVLIVLAAAVWRYGA
jgi:hypothetical protein